MKITTSNKFDKVKIFTSDVYKDKRGFFTEAFNPEIKKELTVDFHQDNLSSSKQGVIRGIHYQTGGTMGKLCKVIKGSGTDFIIDLDPTSPTFGEYELIPLSENIQQFLWVPGTFGHAFLSTEDNTLFYYKCSDVYNPNKEISINPLCSFLNIDWGVRKEDIILSQKDLSSMSFKDYKLKFLKNEQ